ncbi:MAG: hypothetical protein FJW56_08145 [Actinobacteria bacterium]|nr:hypothetical protein [Actinomycetota bacterium]
MKTSSIIIDYLIKYKPKQIQIWKIQSEVKRHGYLVYGILHTAETYAREWRKLRSLSNKSNELEKAKIEFKYVNRSTVELTYK